MKIVMIVQARMTSTRLPGKVLKQVLGKALLEYQIERLQRVKLADQIVIATTTNVADDQIAALCDRLGISYFRGSEADVLARYHGAATKYQADAIVRVTSDCPLIDPQVIDKVLEYYIKNQDKYDYISNCLERTYPRGMDTEVFSFQALDEAFLEATEPPDREHVTLFIHKQPDRYQLGHILYAHDRSQYRWTVDTLEDFDLVQKILEAIYPQNPKFSLEDCLHLIDRYPEWSKINIHIEQKQYGE